MRREKCQAFFAIDCTKIFKGLSKIEKSLTNKEKQGIMEE